MSVSQLLMMGMKGKSAFRFSIQTTSLSETFTLPLQTPGTHTFTVNWGDESTNDSITAYDDADRVHTYALAGTYVITMRGTCTNFAFNEAGDCTKVIKLIEVEDLGFTILNFNGCIGMTSIPGSLKKLTYLTTAYRMFMGCTSLMTIPLNIFDGATLITSFQGAFQSCTGITSSIPTDLFKNNVNTTNMWGVFLFCSGLSGSIPADLFKTNTLVIDSGFVNTFYGCSNLTGAIPIDLFKTNTLINNFNQCFNGCTGLTSIPTDLFRYNIAVGGGTLGFNSIFGNCTGLTTIPSGLFKYNTACFSFGSAFSGCVKAQYPIDLFYDVGGGEATRFLNQSPDFSNCFSRSSFSGVQGTAPDLWNCDFGKGTPIKTDCFEGAGNNLTSLTNYGDIPIEWI